MPASPIIMPDEYIQAGLDTVAVMTARTRVLRPSCRSTGVNLIQSAITVPQTSVSANSPSQRPLVIPWASHWHGPDQDCNQNGQRQYDRYDARVHIQFSLYIDSIRAFW